MSERREAMDAVKVKSDNDGPVTVKIDDRGGPGDRYDEVATILVERGMSWSLRLTWREARDLADALNNVVDIADFG